jgi:CBS domain-containing protein
MTARELMIQVPVLTSLDPLDKVISLFERASIHVAPIINEDHELVGILTKTDIYQFLSKPGHYLSCPVEWIMTKNVLTAHPDTTISEVVSLLRKNVIFSLPIVENQKLVGLVTIESVLDFLMLQYKG